MRRYHSWLVALGFAAATPGLALAGPLSLFSSDRESKPAAPETDAKAIVSPGAVAIARAEVDALHVGMRTRQPFGPAQRFPLHGCHCALLIRSAGPASHRP